MALEFQTPNPLQRAVLDCAVTGKSVAMQCGFNSGKSTALGMAALMIGRSRPGLESAWVTDTRANAGRIVTPIARKYLGAAGWTYHGQHDMKYWRSPGNHICYILYFKPDEASDAQSAPGQGANLTAIFVDEGQKLRSDFQEFAAGRVRVPGPLGWDVQPPWFCVAGLPEYEAWWVEWGERLGWQTLLADSTISPATTPQYLAQLEASLPPEEFEEKVWNRPRPPSDAVWNTWSGDPWPAGNLLEKGWKLNRDKHRVCATIDWGDVNPAVLWIARDEELGARIGAPYVEVVFDEMAPKNVDVGRLFELILGQSWPREYRDQAPDEFEGSWLDDVCADPAGGTEIGVAGQAPTGEGLGRGLGISPLYSLKKERRDRREGVRRVKARIHAAGDRRLLVCTRELWERGQRSGGRSFAKMITRLRWPTGSARADRYAPRNHTHYADALRYWGVGLHWWEDPRDASPSSLVAAITGPAVGPSGWNARG